MSASLCDSQVAGKLEGQELRGTALARDQSVAVVDESWLSALQRTRRFSPLCIVNEHLFLACTKG